MPSINQFVKTVLEKIDFEPVEILVTIDTKFYPNDYGINVRPLFVKVKGDQKIKTFKYNDLKDMLERAFSPEEGKAQEDQRSRELNSYEVHHRSKHVSLLVKETKYRRLSRDPQMIIINAEKKEFEEHEYYDYKIRRLFLRNELEQYDRIRNEAYEFIRENKAPEEEEIPSEMM